MAIIWFLICNFSINAWSGPPCFLRRSEIADFGKLYHQVALIESDDRVLRSPGTVTADIEKAQARSCCFERPFAGTGIPTKKYITSHGRVTSNATLAFEGDMAIVNRHLFIDKKGHQVANVKNCYLEHIASGEIVQMTDVEYPTFDPKAAGTFSHQDFAVVKLAHTPKGASFLKREDIFIDKEKLANAQIKVVSNYAANNTQGRGNEALTMTNCSRFARYSLGTGEGSNSFATDCDTGKGSSGAQAYLQINQSPKFFGIVQGEYTKVPEGGKYDPLKLTTMITAFDQTLFESFERLKSR